MNRDAAHVADSSDAERRLVSAALAQFERLTAGAVGAVSDRDPGAAQSFTIPGYRILREIHRGGQGVVYQAIQESTHRKMAIKVLKEGPFADQTELARFEREVDVLSRLNHPHIVAIHDRGLTAGHAYYVMDYIAGRPLDAYATAARLPVTERVGLFVKVCDAVHVAHLRGVIHRDLKPGNILVVEEEVGSALQTRIADDSRMVRGADPTAEPRILDFGLARFAEDASAIQNSKSNIQNLTITGQFIGSLPWASPEQAAGQSDLLDIRTDVYSLGVILYQLLTGRFPYSVSGRLDEVVRHIRQSSPARPSAVGIRLDHDLELILLKCLAKEPERRYQSASDLAGDLRRYLAHEPVTAISPSAGYRLRKFARRNRGAVIAGALVASTLLIATGVSVAFGLSEARERRAAETARTRAEAAEGEAKARADELEQVAEFQEKQLSGIDAQTMGVRLRSGLLEKARAAADRSKLPPEEADARLAELEQLIAGSDFTGMALEALDDNFFQPALAVIEKQFGDQPLVQARLLQTLASTLYEVGLLDAASGPQEKALAIRRRELGDEHPDTLRSLHNMGGLLQAQGKLSEAEPFYREALEQRRRSLGEEHRDTLTSLSSVGYLLMAQGHREQAEPYYREVLEKRRRVLGDEHPHTLFAINNMAALLQTQRRFSEAETLYSAALERRRRVLGDEHADTLQSLNNLGNLLEAQRRNAEAEPYYRAALEKRRRVLGDDHPNTLNSISNLGTLLQSEGRLDEAELFTLEALEKRRRLLGNDHPDTLTSMNNMGVLRDEQGRLAEAEAYLREVLEGTRRVLGDEHPKMFMTIVNLSSLLQTQGKHGEAVELLAGAEPTARRRFTGPNAPRLGRFLIILGHARVAAGQFDAAEANLSEAHEILSAAGIAPEWNPSDALVELAQLYDARHTAEPDQGYDAKAAEWSAELAEWQASTQPAAP